MADKARNEINKKKKLIWLSIYNSIYHLVVVGIFFAEVRFSLHGLLMVAGVCIAHVLINWAVKHIPSKRLIATQLLNVFAIIVFWWIWVDCVSLREHGALRQFIGRFNNSPEGLLLIMLGLLWALKPISELIAKGEIWDFNKDDKDAKIQTPDKAQKDSGKMIGYLERILVFFLLINGEFTAIAFVITAKSIARIVELGNSKKPLSLAEYYIIGTLLSITSVFVITFLLGLI